MECRSAARVREGLSWGSRWYKPKGDTLPGAFFDPGRLRSAGTGAQIGGKEKTWSTTRLQAPACGRSDQFRSQTVWYHKKGRGRVWGTAGSCHTWSEAEVPAAAGGIWHSQMPWQQKKKAPFGALFFWCGRWDSNPHTEVLASKTRASTIPPLPLISLWPCTFTKQQADKYPYYTIFSLGLSIPRPVPTVRGLPVYRRCVRIES